MNREIIKFLIVGVISTILNYLSFSILFKILTINYLISSAIGYMSGLVLGYSLNKNWTFEYKNENMKTKLQYLIVYLTNLVISLLILKILETKFGINPMIGNVLVICYTTVANYIGIKIFVFSGDKS